MRCYVKGVLVLYLPIAPTPAIVPMVMPAIAPDESFSDVPGPSKAVVRVVSSVVFCVVVVALDEPGVSVVVVRDMAIVAVCGDPVEVGRPVVWAVVWIVVWAVVWGWVVVGIPVVVATHRATVSIKAKRQKRVEGESLKCSLYDITLKMIF